MKQKRLILFSLLIMLFVIEACKKTNYDEELNNGQLYPNITSMDELIADPYFDWNMSGDIEFEIQTLDNQNNPIPGVILGVYQSLSDKEVLLFSGITNSYGLLIALHPLPPQANEIIIRTNFIGLSNEAKLLVENQKVTYTFGGREPGFKSASQTVSSYNSSYSYLGTYNSQGVPNYLEPVNDVISAGLLNNINAALPENQPVPQYHPEYLSQSNETNLILLEDAEVWVTFVHEGAGYKNVLGFYTYTYGNAPTTVNDIDTITIIYPNVSFYNSGGGLYSGNKVELGLFTANTVIGWVLIANGWQNGAVTNGNNIFYSNSELNPENDPTLRQHNVLLYDAEYDLILIGFEDLLRTSGDDDFNDAIFYTTSNPPTAVNIVNLPLVDPTLIDSDGDSIVDAADSYPNDPNKAFNHYYPGQNQYGTLAYEDLWPSKGDYDFNDLVIDYNFNEITNSVNEIVQIDASFTITAVGASVPNGFGFELALPSGGVSNVTGANLQENIINLSASNTELGQTNATIIVFDNAFNVFNENHVRFINTVPVYPTETPASITVSVMLANPINILNFPLPPYNPFIFINKERGREVHLPGYPPTSLANANYFGTDDDDTDISIGKYYKSVSNLPWAMHLPVSFDYPIEKKAIIDGHLMFDQWVQSDGYSFMDWYENRPGYRNTSNIFNMD